ncbi:unnamed protein product [Miscanthus lutarioriparius]|uniref:Uncharacterized protein n=1 Tax=Miscanthus lutarioriparius TaxID=422564 RepID=A0A811Q2I4_9POAL|nr:unnamed protein product [Miscanthus lutarioriparius]
MSRPAASPLASFLRSTSPPPVPQPGAWRASRKKDGAAEQGRGDGRWRRHLAGVLGEEEPEPQDGGGVCVRGRGGSCRRYVFACSVFASLNHVLLGYDVGVMSWCIIFIQKDLHITKLYKATPSIIYMHVPSIARVLPYGATMARFTTTCSFKDGALFD